MALPIHWWTGWSRNSCKIQKADEKNSNFDITWELNKPEVFDDLIKGKHVYIKEFEGAVVLNLTNFKAVAEKLEKYRPEKECQHS